MERLTSKYWRNLDPWEMCGQDNYCKRGCHDQGGCTKGCIVPRIYARLAAYEDTGLEPEEIIGLKNTYEQLSGINDSLFKANQEIGKDLAEWKKANDDGRMVVLPCKVGDHVCADGREAIVVWFFGYKTERYLHAQFLDNAEYTDIPFYEIGKTVFLTREEAEATLALKGGEG